VLFSVQKTCGHYDAILKVLEEERDYYKREYEMARAMRHRATSPSRLSPPTRDRSSDDGDVQRLTRERDELQNLLDKFERHMAEVGTLMHWNFQSLTNFLTKKLN
jgi:centrosomal protein CEP135